MNLKATIEKRNALVDKAKAKAKDVENRDLNTQEIAEMNHLQNEIRSLDGQIQAEKETRSKNRVEIKENGVDKMKITKDMEVRAVEQFLRRKDGQELRDLKAEGAITAGNSEEGTAGNGGITIPVNVHNEIIEMIGEQSPIFAAVRQFPSSTGQLKVAREDGLDDEGFIGELADATKLAPKLKSVTLNQKRVAAGIQLSNQVLNDSAMNLLTYSQGRLSRSLARAIERGILVGAKTGEDAGDTFRPIIGDADVETIKLAAATPTVEELIDLYGSLNPAYLNGAMFIVSRPVFNGMLKLKDGDGAYLILRDQVQGMPGYTLFGVPVFVSDVLNDEKAKAQIVFGNFGEAYGMLVKKGFNLINVSADTTQALAGGQLSVLDTYMDGAVINPKAVVTATAGKGEEGSP